MKEALVIHPQFFYYAGGELLCLHVCKALQDMGYHVTLACDVFNPPAVEKIYGMGKVMERCSQARVPEFRKTLPILLGLQKQLYGKRVWPLFRKTNAEVVFSTQSSPFIIPHRQVFHFVYNKADLFGYPPAASPLNPPQSNEPLRRIYYSILKFQRKLTWDHVPHGPTWFLAVGSGVLNDLREMGHRNSSLIFPPCRTHFQPRFPKKKRVVQVTRIIPDKRLEVFFQIAEKLPEYPFYIVGRDPPALQKLNPGYSTNLLVKMPKNVVYIEAVIREQPELLQESKIYLYTGVERGIGMAFVEALGAGCIPFSPPEAGAADIIRASEVGYIFRSPDEAAAKIRTALETKYSDDEVRGISDRARMFSSERFEREVKTLVRASTSES